VRIEAGSHMPTWRYGVDYRKVYSANKSMGGGIILDGIHELDYACWLFGYPDSVRGSFGTLSNFEIDVEDTANIQFTYEDKLIEIHLDYLQKRYTRTCKICLRDGNTIEWTFGESVIEHTDGNRQAFIYKDRFNINDLYLEEMKTFLHHIKERTMPKSNILNAAMILNLALRVKEGEE
jgi:predicted dehydrogenase